MLPLVLSAPHFYCDDPLLELAILVLVGSCAAALAHTGLTGMALTDFGTCARDIGLNKNMG